MQKSPAILCVHVFQRVTMLACGSTLPKRSECVQKQVSYKGEEGVGFPAARSGYDTRVMLRRGSGGDTGNSAHRQTPFAAGGVGRRRIPACLPLASVYLHYVPPLIQTLQWFSCVRECKTSLPVSWLRDVVPPASSPSSSSISVFISYVQAHHFAFGTELVSP